MTNTQMANTVTPDDLARVQEQVEALQAARQREAAEKQAQADVYSKPPEPKVHPASFSGRMAHYQDEHRRVREEALAEVDEANERHAASVATKRESLEKQLLELDGRFREEEQRHSKALEPITAKQAKVRKQLNQLMTAPLTFEQAMERPERRAELERLSEQCNNEFQIVGADEYEDVRFWNYQLGRWTTVGRRKGGPWQRAKEALTLPRKGSK